MHQRDEIIHKYIGKYSNIFMPVTTRRATKYPNQQNLLPVNIQSNDTTPNGNLRGIKRGRNVNKGTGGKRASSSKSLVSNSSSKRNVVMRKKDSKQVEGNKGKKRMPWESDEDLDKPRRGSRANFSASELDDESSSLYSENDAYSSEDDNLSTVSDFDRQETAASDNAGGSQTSLDIFCPWMELSPENIPILNLPGSSMDLLIDSDHMLHTLEAFCFFLYLFPISALRYNFLPSFSRIFVVPSAIRSKLLGEIHIAFLRLFFSEEEQEKTSFSVFDTNLSFNIVLQLLDHMNYAEVLKQYVESDNFSADVLQILVENNYPFVSLDKRLVILKWMCERFFNTNIFKRLVRDEGKIKHDQHCRFCAKSCNATHDSQQISIECSGCDAIYHVNCTENSISSSPISNLNDNWFCCVCIKHRVSGATDCILPGQTSLRKLPLGYDRKGRIYWFLVRRIFIYDPVTNEIYYYSTLPQLYDLCSVLDPIYFERRLCQTLSEVLPHIAVKMHITLELTEERRKLLQTKSPKPIVDAYLQVDNAHRMGKILAQAQFDAAEKSPSRNDDSSSDNVEKPSIIQIVRNLLCIRRGRLEASFWSGGLNEDQLLLDHKLWSDSFESNNCGSFDSFPSDLELRMRRGIRLGFSDAGHRNYVNQFSVNELAKSPYLRAKERDKKRYLNSRFCLADDGEFIWPNHRGASPFGTERDVLNCIQLSLRRLIERIPDTLMHQNWILENEKQRFMKQLTHESVNFDTLRYLLLLFERVVRKPVFLSIWWAGLALTKFYRVTLEDREKRQKFESLKKKEEKLLSNADPSDSDSADIVWVKYSLFGLNLPKHNLWKLRDEQFRVNGHNKLGGWLWFSSLMKRNYVPTPERPNLNWKPSKSIAYQKSVYLNKIVNRLLVWRIKEELSKISRKNVPCCFSLACRAAFNTANLAKNSINGTLNNGFSWIDSSILLPCYNPSCVRNKPNVFSSEKPARAKNPLLKQTTLQSMTKIFPYPKPYNFTRKSNINDGKTMESILVLPKWFFKLIYTSTFFIFMCIHRLARQGGLNAKTLAPGFLPAAKANPQAWPYPCPRPAFDHCWRYLTSKAKSFHALALRFRQIYASIRWMDMWPSDPDDPDTRVWTHLADHDEVRLVIGHLEHPPEGYYEQYKIRVDHYSIDDEDFSFGVEDGNISLTNGDTDFMNPTASGKRKRKRPINYLRSGGEDENRISYSQQTRNRKRIKKTTERWFFVIDGVELKLYEIADYWKSELSNKKKYFYY
ncbi:hypothetical protein Mgra_00001943 [Meloidogyne graminicola]|uniref:PHD-type domain-containing protein n=1 Tax=Meloidogyne graminicola TaxID=189291 RepID=A0A8S9ZZK6_9BILA|nr:hypothetical protein Mgra_00001943 [Meloidogyne graminicola]